MDDQDAARQNVKRLLRLRGLTVKGLAEAAGLASSTVYNWYRDNEPTALGPGALASIAAVLEVAPEHLFYNATHGPPPEDEARARVLRQIDVILANIDDPQEQDRAGALILATLRAFQDGFERQRAAQPGARRAGNGPAAGAAGRAPGPRG